MLGAGLQFNRSRNGDDRFYCAAKARRNNHNQSRSQNHHRQNQSQTQDHLRRAKSDVAVSHSRKPESQPPHKVEDGNSNCKNTMTSPRPAVTSSPSCSNNNLQRFLDSVTPSVTSQYLSKTTMRGRRMCDVEFRPYFLLGDLWEAFREWSAYGAGVPLILNDSDSVVQYYVPYLSGIQLYGDESKLSSKPRRLGEDSDGDYFRDTSSEGSSDGENDRGYSVEQRGYHFQTSDVSLGIDRLSSRDPRLALQEGFSSDEGEPGTSQGCLLFEYLERDQPYCREPLADKISQLALQFPKLKTLRSCDLLASSWISVAWYPIYRIPTGPTLKDLDACFLTYHSLHTPMTGMEGSDFPVVSYPSEMDGVPKISLPVFGLASYKLKVSLWTPSGGCERQLLNSLLQAADNWLSLLQVNHPDFVFFSRR